LIFEDLMRLPTSSFSTYTALHVRGRARISRFDYTGKNALRHDGSGRWQSTGGNGGEGDFSAL